MTVMKVIRVQYALIWNQLAQNKFYTPVIVKLCFSPLLHIHTGTCACANIHADTHTYTHSKT